MYSIYDDGRHYSLMYPVNESGLKLWLDLGAESDGTVIAPPISCCP